MIDQPHHLVVGLGATFALRRGSHRTDEDEAAHLARR